MTFTKLFEFIIFVVATTQCNGDYKTIYKEPDASNCVKIGRGVIPVYESCGGCKVEAAHECINDLRNNAGNNVPSSCKLDTLTGSTAKKAQQSQACCPKFLHDDQPESINTSTSAYPDAFLCLENIGCQNSNAYYDLLYECEELCSGLYSGDTGTTHACAPTENIGCYIRRISYLTITLVFTVTMMSTCSPMNTLDF